MAGVTSATSSAVARAGELHAVATGLGSEKGKGGRGSWAHGDLEEPDGAVGDELVRW